MHCSRIFNHVPEVAANYCLVMVIDKAINTARDFSCWSTEIPLWPLVEFFFFQSRPPLARSTAKRVKRETLFFLAEKAQCGGENNAPLYTVMALRARAAETQVQVNQCYQAHRLIYNHIVIWRLISASHPPPPSARP